MDEEINCNDIPISVFKSNNIQKKEKVIQSPGCLSPGGQARLEAPLSPGASFAMRDISFKRAAQGNYFKSVAGMSNDNNG